MTTKLNPEDSRKFVETLDNPPEPNDALKAAAASHQTTGQRGLAVAHGVKRVTVVAAALERNGITFSKMKPARHNHIISALHRSGFSTDFIAGCTQGFLLSDGDFADRRVALSVVEIADQPTRGPLRDELFSEDLW